MRVSIGRFTMSDQHLESMAPADAVQLYKQDRRDEVSAATLQSHGYRLGQFLKWCEEYDHTDLNNLSGRDIQRFKLYRKTSVKAVTLKSTMDTLRVFLRFCESIDACREGLAESVVSPSLSREENVSSAILDSERADIIEQYLSKFSYASREHALFKLLTESAMRIGAAHSIDLPDLDLKDAYVELHHRDQTDTPLKNGKRGERTVSLTPDLVFVLEDYIEENRPETTDEHGREPLFGTRAGRAAKTTMRVWINEVTRPCAHGQDCPHDRDPETCEAVTDRMMASKCPSSESPHALRRGGITRFLKEDIPIGVVSDEVNCTSDVLSTHYDSRSKRERMEQRRGYFTDL